ncbi:MAG: flagellar basal body rod protein FlgB [Gammaproteobacteria bacterium]|nr:flagellar basal body rod protein FlgB [Gammaproteobacteria bacterium]
MSNSFFGIHESALQIREQRAEVLATNLANADTPNFKARDIDFRAALNDASEDLKPTTAMSKTHAHHLEGSTGFGSTDAYLKYRQPTQPSLDGNTVETHIEKAQFMENGLQQTATLEFINGKIMGLRGAIRGE